MACLAQTCKQFTDYATMFPVDAIRNEPESKPAGAVCTTGSLPASGRTGGLPLSRRQGCVYGQCAGRLSKTPRRPVAGAIARGFGSSDCRGSGHLVYPGKDSCLLVHNESLQIA